MNYKQHGDTCAIVCMMAAIKTFDDTYELSKQNEKKLYDKYKSKYTIGVPLSAVAFHLMKNNFKVNLIHSEKDYFTNKNNYFSNELYDLLLNEYKTYLNKIETSTNIEINEEFLKTKLDLGSIIILSGIVNKNLHNILITKYKDSQYYLYDPLI